MGAKEQSRRDASSSLRKTAVHSAKLRSHSPPMQPIAQAKGINERAFAHTPDA